MSSSKKEIYMGYRSDAGLCLTRTGKNALDARLAELEPEAEGAENIHALLNSPRDKREEDGAITWLWESLKWYSDYQDVAFIENLLNELDTEDYLFICVGESDDDTEYRGGFWDNPFAMGLGRCIVFG
jgi:hypothetical protein